MTNKSSLSLMDPALVKPAVIASFAKLSPQAQWRNPVMFVVYVGSIVTTLLGIQALQGQGEAPAWFILTIAVWLWFTVLFANFAESLAEGRSKAQAASLRSLKKSTWAKKLKDPVHGSTWLPEQAENLRRGDVVLVEAGDTIPVDGEATTPDVELGQHPSLGMIQRSDDECPIEPIARRCKWPEIATGLDRYACKGSQLVQCPGP